MMIRACLAVFIGICITACTTVAHPLRTGHQSNVLILGQDDHNNSAACDSSLYEIVHLTLNDQLASAHYNTLNAAAVLQDQFSTEICGASDADLIDMARSVTTPPIDILILFQVYGAQQQTAFANKFHITIAGRLINLRTKRTIRNFTVASPQELNAPRECSADCLIHLAREEGQILAQDLGNRLAELLGIWQAELHEKQAQDGNPVACADNNAYRIVFNDFHRDEIRLIEEYLAAFRCYRHYQPTRVTSARSEYWYETTANTARLNRNLNKMLDHLSVQGRIAYANKTFTVHKLKGGKQR